MVSKDLLLELESARPYLSKGQHSPVDFSSGRTGACACKTAKLCQFLEDVPGSPLHLGQFPSQDPRVILIVRL